MNINIEVRNDDGSIVESAGCGNFESATEQLGKMERRWKAPLVQANALDPIREAQMEDPILPEDDEDLGKDDNDFRLTEDETLIND